MIGGASETANHILTASHAFVPGRLNLAHAAGTYLPADVCHRLCRLFGITSRFVTGIDVHGSQAARAVRASGLPKSVAYQRYEEAFRRGLSSLRIEPTDFIRTDDERLPSVIEYGMARLAEKGLIRRHPAIEHFCRRCGEYRAKSEIRIEGTNCSLREVPHRADTETMLQCAVCFERLKPLTTYQWRMRLPRDEVLNSLLQLQPFRTARRQMLREAASDFHEWEFSRSNYHGLPMPLDRERQLYVWCDALFAKLLTLGAPADIPQALARTRFVCFFGKNVAHYYGLIFSTLLRFGFDCAEPRLLFSMRGFGAVDPADRLLELEDALATYTADELRFYCAYVVPDDMKDFTLTRAGLRIVIRSVLGDTFGRYFARATERLAANGLHLAVGDAAWTDVMPQWQHLTELVLRSEVRRVLLELEAYVRQQIARDVTADSDRQLGVTLAIVYSVLACYVPEWVQQYRLFGIDPEPIVTASLSQVSW